MTYLSVLLLVVAALVAVLNKSNDESKKKTISEVTETKLPRTKSSRRNPVQQEENGKIHATFNLKAKVSNKTEEEDNQNKG